MSIQQVTWAFEQEDLTSPQKFVLVVLANYSDSEGSAFPSATKIAQQTSLNKETVWKALKALEDKGLIVRESRRRPDGTQTSNRYWVTSGRDSDPGDGEQRTESRLPPSRNPVHHDPKEEPSDTTTKSAGVEDIQPSPVKTDPKQERKPSATEPLDIGILNAVQYLQAIPGWRPSKAHKADELLVRSLMMEFPDVDMEYQLKRAAEVIQKPVQNLEKWLRKTWLPKAISETAAQRKFGTPKGFHPSERKFGFTTENPYPLLTE